jgi:hypothetical protein
VRKLSFDDSKPDALLVRKLLGVPPLLVAKLKSLS